MKKINQNTGGFSLIELLISLAIGLVLVGAVLVVVIAQTRMSKTVVSQASIQNSENAIAALVTPAIRSAGFSGCTQLTQPMTSVLNAGGPPPLSTLIASNAYVMGYDAVGTAGAGTTLNIAANNSTNSSNAANWSPALDASLLGNVEAGSDVIVVLGPVPNSSPIGVTTMNSTPGVFSVQNTTNISTNQFGVVSNCLNATIFLITGVTATTVSHATGSGAALTNSTATFPVTYANNQTQFIPLQQTAFFVGQGTGSQSTLMQATYSNGAWSVQPLIPGVDSLQVLYGTGTVAAGITYVAASAVTNWALVSSIQLGFLIEGQNGSGGQGAAGANTYSVLGTAITVPTDGRLRHVYQMTIDLRNST